MLTCQVRRSMEQHTGKGRAKGVMVILNDRGLHTRPATELVKCASSFKSRIMLRSHDMEVNGKSLLGLLTLTATKGTKIRIEAEGLDAEEAVAAILDLAKNQFNIRY